MNGLYDLLFFFFWSKIIYSHFSKPKKKKSYRESDTLVWALRTISLLSGIRYRFYFSYSSESESPKLSAGGGIGGPTTSSSSSTESNRHGWVSERWESGFGRGRKRRELIVIGLVCGGGGATSGAVDGFERGLGLWLLCRHEWKTLDHGSWIMGRPALFTRTFPFLL